MSNPNRSRSLVFGIAAVFALTLLAPPAVTAEEEVIAVVPLAAPSVDETRAEAVRSARAIAAERALQSGDIGSLQEEHLGAIVAAAPTLDATSDFGSVAGSHVAKQTRVLAAQQALHSPDLGSMQEEALIIVVTTGAAGAETRTER